LSSFQQIVEVLQKHGLRFVIIGGHAVNFHGFIRATEDVDVLLCTDKGYDAKLLTALLELKAYQITDEIDPETGIERTRPVSENALAGRSLHMVGTEYGYLDIFCFVPGFPETDVEQVWSEAVVSQGQRYVSLRWLRLLKESAARPIDQVDLANLPSA
jgi:hypothetical protein